MSTVHQLLALIIIAWFGFVVISILLLPTVLESRRQKSSAGGFILAKTFAEGWLLVYFSLLLIHYFFHWYPPFLNRVLASAIALGVWVQVAWFLRWQWRVKKGTHT